MPTPRDAMSALLAQDLQATQQAISSAAELLNGESEARDVQAAAETIRRQAAWQAQRLSDLRDLTQVRRGELLLQLGPCELRQLLTEAVELTNLLRVHGVNLRLDLPRRPVLLLLDRARMMQAVTNLLAVAARFTDVGGQNALSLVVNKLIWIRVLVPGIGISAEMLTRLWLTKQLIERHGGGVRVHAEGATEGVEIAAYLPINKAPRVPRPLKPPAPARASRPAEPPRKRRVLFVDDNADLCELMSFLFTQAGHTLLIAKDGVTGLEMALRERPDLVICDLALPRLDGLTLASRLRQEASTIPLIALSRYADQEMQKRAIDAGFSRYFVKPIALEAFLDAVDSLPDPASLRQL